MSSMRNKALEERVEEWLSTDQDDETRAEILRLWKEKNESELNERFSGRIQFGTAGLRARMEGGTTRMNSLTVMQASQGLASYLLSVEPKASSKGVVIGRDARYNSQKFAALTAAAFVAKGIEIRWLDVVHTPLVPFAVKMFNAAAGVMITASHNPAQDNGYKVYWSNGCQIIPPHDKRIAASIDQNLTPVSWDQQVVERGDPLISHEQEAVETAYYDAVKKAVITNGTPSIPSFVYTAMHGVGLRPMQAVLERLVPQGSPSAMAIVEEQAHPDPAFPTVKFPNPEEKGALDCSIKLADARGIPLIIATDPDADRLAVAQKLSNGQWHQFTGNQLGILLAVATLERLPADRSNYAMLNSTVSTGMLAQMAKQEGFHFIETLTGFKWLGNVAQQLAKDKGFIVPFAFEEALGYMFTAIAHDKDGISAAAFFLVAAARWRDDESLTPWEKLQQLYQKYGYFADANTYVISPSATITSAVFEDIRALSGSKAWDSHPTHLGTKKILRWRDLTKGYDSGTANGVPDLPVDSSIQMITCELEGETRFTVRGSGTEPKIKMYIETRAKSMQEAAANSKDVQDSIMREWFPVEKYGLKLA